MRTLMAHVLLYWLMVVMRTLLPCVGMTLFDPSRSYAVFEKWTATQHGSFHFRFKTHSIYCLLVYVDDSGSMEARGNDYMQLSLVKGELQVVVKYGRDSVQVRKSVVVGTGLNDLAWHTIELRRYPGFITIKVDQVERVITLDDVKDNRRLTLDSYLFVGGIPGTFDASVTSKDVGYMPRFIGCIDNVRIASEHGESRNATVLWSHSINPVCIDACESAWCANGGRCLNWFTQVSCDCLGTGYEGANCSIRSTPIYFNGMTFLKWNSGPALSGRMVNIELRFKPRSMSGTLLAIGTAENALVIELHRGKIKLSLSEMVVSLAMELAGFRAKYETWYSMRVSCRRDKLIINLNNRFHGNWSIGCHLLESTSFSSGIVYIGGRPQDALSDTSSTGGNFSGCIQQIDLHGVNVIYKIYNTKSTNYDIVGSLRSGCAAFPKPEETTTLAATTAAWTTKMSGSVSDLRRLVTTNNASVPTTADTTTVSIKRPTTQDLDIGNLRHLLTEQNKMSTETIAWITTGIVVGIIAVMFLSACLYNRCKYKGKRRHHFITATYKTPPKTTNSPRLTRSATGGDLALAEGLIRIKVSSPLVTNTTIANGHSNHRNKNGHHGNNNGNVGNSNGKPVNHHVTKTNNRAILSNGHVKANGHAGSHGYAV